jgi:pimeloyl-ACP methyl ester carboxylesterase
VASGREGEVEIGAWTLARRSLGDGPPLLLVNGYAATGADWDPELLSGLASAFEVICPDSRGMGGSTLVDGPLTVDAMVADLEALLDALGLERVALAGWSMGGFVAQRLAELAPARVSALALLSSDAGGPQALRPDPAVWARLTDHSGTPREQASRLISLLFPPELAPEIDREFGDAVAAARAALSEPALSAQEEAMDAWLATEREAPDPATAPPVLIVHGVEDAVIPVANAELLAARWPGARIERIEGGGHAFMAQEPERTAALIAAHAARATGTT